MVINEMAINFSDLIYSLPIETTDKILELVLVLKAFGIAAIVYAIYVVVMGVLTYRRMKKVEQIEGKADAISKKIDLINRKLDKLAKKS